MRNFLNWLGLDWHWALIPVALVVVCVVSYLLMVVWDSFWDWREDHRAARDEFDADLTDLPGLSVARLPRRSGSDEASGYGQAGELDDGLPEWDDCERDYRKQDDAWAVELHHMNHELAQPMPPEREWDFAVWEVEQANWLADRHAEALRVDEMLTAGEWADPWWIKQPT